jgi:hypothetical protein
VSWRRPRAFALRLHVSAAPPRVGLTQALAGKAMNLSKSEIAKRQIETACGIFLSGGDFLAVVTLAGAAEEILGNLLKRAGKANSMDDILALDQRLFGGRPFKGCKR